jgi:hypothetical protein
MTKNSKLMRLQRAGTEKERKKKRKKKQEEKKRGEG